MKCDNCGAEGGNRGNFIMTEKDLATCKVCGMRISDPFPPPSSHHKWDQYFHTICRSISSKSPCLSRQIGAILVRDHSIISTGFNGPSRGIPHCGNERNARDEVLIDLLSKVKCKGITNQCPRKVLGYASGTHMELCNAQHAEENAVSNAARLGVSVLGSTLYMNSLIPCQKCFGTLINAGIIEVVVDETAAYDKFTAFLINNSSIKIRRFEL